MVGTIIVVEGAFTGMSCELEQGAAVSWFLIRMDSEDYFAGVK
ncbi:MAG: hypothetical protein ACLFQB_11980 [Chitinispirillaceae bacterium]